MEFKIENDKKLIFLNRETKISPFFKQEDFSLKIDDIAIIAYKEGVFFDSDYEYLIFITKTKKSFFIPYSALDLELILTLKKYYNINLDNLFKFKDKECYNRFDNRILYPLSHSGLNLYRKMNFAEKFFLLLKKISLKKHFVKGILSLQSLNILDSK